ncbi:MAG: YggT family protein [Clostridia bacterium]|nr:YggT family protein [Clostridia bacterium]MBQ1375337.1 YggT family protein [Clostridia bacterium]MBQ1435708.1 YggT family protein [Clostridia bacterium]MBQ4250113.1 YggT family protein [Clostridia bacterium]
MHLITGIIWILQLLIVIRAVISWIRINPNRFTYWIARITEPILEPIRRLMMRSSFLRQFPVDFSPVAAYLILALISRIIRRLYYYSLF